MSVIQSGWSVRWPSSDEGVRWGPRLWDSLAWSKADCKQNSDGLSSGLTAIFGPGDRILPAPAPGVAAADAPDDEPERPGQRMKAKGLQGVLGAGGVEAAGARLEWGDEEPVGVDQQEKRGIEQT